MPSDVDYVKRNRGRLSVRQISEKLRVSRAEVEKIIQQSDFQKVDKPFIKFFPLIVAIVAILGFANATQNGFVWDDRQMILEDSTIGVVRDIPKNLSKPLAYHGQDDLEGDIWRPMVSLTLTLDTILWRGKNAFGMHLTNVLLHAVVAYLFYLIATRVLGSSFYAFAAAVLYAVHPIHSESVAYITVRSEILSGLFILLTLMVYKKSTPAALACYLMAIFSKETAITTALLVPAYSIFTSETKDMNWKRTISVAFPYFIVAAVYLLLRNFVVGGLGSVAAGDTSHGFFAWSNRVWMQPVYLGEYMKMIFYPFDLHTWRQMYWPQTISDPAYYWPLITFCIFWSAGLWSLYKRQAFGLGFLWFYIFMLPVMNLLIVVNSPVLEHWLYNPYMGLCLLVCGWIRYFAGEKPIVLKVGGVLLLVTTIFLIQRSWVQNETWKDEIRLFEHTTQYVKRDPLLYTNLGVAYAENKEWEKAEESFNRAIALDPSYEDAQYNLRLLKRQKAS